MNSNLNNILLCGLVFAVSASFPQLSSAAIFEREISGEFFSQSGRELVVDTGSGDIHVRSGEDDSTLIQVKLAVKTSSQEKADEIFDAMEIEILEAQTGVQVQVRQNSSFSFWGWIFGKRAPTVEVFAICPKISDINLDTGSGNIFISGVEGQIVLDTGSGDIKGEALAGSVSADTGSGNIQLEQVAGSFIGDTGSGSIKVSNLAGSFEGDTGSGKIQARGNISRFSADTGSGSVIIESYSNNLQPSSIRTGSGNVDLYLPVTAIAQFKASTSSGEIQAGFPAARISEASDDSIHLVLNDGEALISAQTGSGDISLYPGTPQGN